MRKQVICQQQETVACRHSEINQRSFAEEKKEYTDCTHPEIEHHCQRADKQCYASDILALIEKFHRKDE